MNLSLTQRVRLALTGRVYVGDRQRPGGRTPLPFYAFKCSKHGIVTNYLQGHGKKLVCPECHREEAQR